MSSRPGEYRSKKKARPVEGEAGCRDGEQRLWLRSGSCGVRGEWGGGLRGLVGGLVFGMGEEDPGGC